MVRRDRLIGALFLAIGIVTAGLAVYYYTTFLGLENPLTHVMPSSTDYFSYAENYFQTRANYELSWKVSAVALCVASFSFVFRSIKDLPVFKPLHNAHAFIHGQPQAFKTITLAIPLVLLETGLILYGSLMGLASSDLSLSVQVRDQPVVRALFLGPLGPFGGASFAEQDYYFLILFIGVLTTSFYRFGSVRRVLQIGALSIIPLPTLIYFFDRIEFNTFFASVVDRYGLPWFSNAILLYLSIGVFVMATAFPRIRRLASQVLKHAYPSAP